ncbi:putative membrane protein [Bernardetia litoralis DSM 6794]|uniref:Putative membrane protein n=1 Tax=Bernardetia litoralis (strain ATCC 23117 / DSM 6794 / NBRC 15988 / NCIMB 1366 / Fx l1 / Sio-4) TaxID=880071 RepID=I4AIP4_BERLS|nr:rhomboid family intramembrane serine protease [Bernardetia litoralis]AFM03829.1 putative membrane protein [Bernardetia litoralis DSM 6794]
MELRDRLSYEWNKSNNVLMRIIMINVALYLTFALFILIAKFTNMAAIMEYTYKVFYLPPSFEEFIYRPWTLLSYGFMHSLKGFNGILHILFNMLVLYWFGQIVVSEIGSNRFLGLYIWGILAGGVAFLLIFSFVPFFAAQKTMGLVGASAGVYAIVIAAGTLMPNVKMNLFIIGEVSLKWIAIAYVVLSFVMLAGGDNAGGDIAHLAGAGIGYLFVVQYKKGNDWSKPVMSFITFFQNIFKRKPKMKAYRGGQSSQKTDDANSQKQARAKKTTEEQNTIDAILDKISDSGYESLTQKEKQILFQASKK